MTDMREKATSGGQPAATGPEDGQQSPEARREGWEGFSLEHWEEPTSPSAGLRVGVSTP